MRLARLGAVPLGAVLILGSCDSSPTSPPQPPPARAASAPPAAGVEAGAASFEPFACESVDRFRARPTVSGRRVEVAAHIDASALHGTWSRVVFWPEGRHTGPRIVSDLFESGNSDDFPVELTLEHRFPESAAPGERRGNVDFEMLSKCFDEVAGRFVLGGLDPSETCIPGEFIVLQCDRGISITIR